MRMQEGQVPHPSESRGERQFSALAISSANSFLPIPSSPAKRSAPGKRPDFSIRLSTSFTRAFPVSRSNIWRTLTLAFFRSCFGHILHRSEEMAFACQKRHHNRFYALVGLFD